MKTCPKCNTPNKDEFMFCENCGASLKEVAPENAGSGSPAPMTQAPTEPVPVNPGPVSPAPVNQVPVNPVPVSPNPVNTAPVNAAPKKKSSPLLKIILAVVAAGVLYFLISSLFSNPTYKLLNGLAKLSKMDKSTMTMNVDIAYDGSEDAEILNDVSFKTVIATDINNLLAESSIELLYKNKSVTKALAGINNEDVYVDLLNLYKDNKFYQELDGVIPDYTDYVNDIKIVIKALNDTTLKIDKKKYADIVKDVLKKDIKSSGSKIIVTIDSETAVELLNEILSEAADDEKLMKAVRTYAVDVIKKVQKNKNKLEIIDEDMLEEALNTLEDEDEFEDAYQSAIDEALSELEYAGEDLGEEVPEIKMTFNFGLFNNITGMEYAMNIEDEYNDQSFDITFKADIKNGAKFTKINKKNAIEIQELVTDQDQLTEISEQVTENLVKAIKKHDELVETIEDLSGQDIDDAIGSAIGNSLYFGY